MNDTERLWRLREVAAALSLHPNTLWTWVQRGQIPAIRLPSGQYRIKDSDFRALLEAEAVPA